MKTHDLKLHPMFYDDLASERKAFEVRRDDRDFQVGDVLVLRAYLASAGGYQFHPPLVRRVTYVLRDAVHFGVQPGFVVLGLEREVDREGWRVLAEAYLELRRAGPSEETTARVVALLEARGWRVEFSTDDDYDVCRLTMGDRDHNGCGLGKATALWHALHHLLAHQR